jgi:hypothetical protein
MYSIGNDAVQSWLQWRMSPVGYLGEKYRLVMSSMDKLMNLSYNFDVSHRTATECPLTGSVLDYIVVGCMQCIGYSLVGAPHRDYRETYKLQSPNLDRGVARNMGYPKARKGYGYGGTVVGTMLGNTSRLVYPLCRMDFHTSSGSNIELSSRPKGYSFKPSVSSPLKKKIISQECENKLIFAQLDPSKLIHAICHPDVLIL